MTITPGLTVDQSGNIIDAMAAAEAAGGGVVMLPDGDVLSANPLPPFQNVVLRGSSAHACRLWFEGAWSDPAIDLMGPGTGTPPADRRFTGVTDLTILGTNLSSTSLAGAIRAGNNERTVELAERLIISGFPGDGFLIDANDWNVSIREVQIAACAFRAAGTAGFRKNPAVTDINSFRATRLYVEGCGRPDQVQNGRYKDLCCGINVQTTTMATNRSWVWDQCQAEGNYGIIEWFMKNMRRQVMIAPYIETRAGGNIGMEWDDVNGEIIVPSFDAAPASGGLLAPDKALKFYGGSRVTVTGYDRGSGWVTSDLETYNTAVAALINCDPTLRLSPNYDNSRIVRFPT